jgi:hypothetical protein
MIEERMERNNNLFSTVDFQYISHGTSDSIIALSSISSAM